MRSTDDANTKCKNTAAPRGYAGARRASKATPVQAAALTALTARTLPANTLNSCAGLADDCYTLRVEARNQTASTARGDT